MYWYCVMVAGLLPYFCALIAKSKMPLSANRHPRLHTSDLKGYRARANWAQQNGFEAFPFFATAVIAAHVEGVAKDTLNILALCFVVLRVLYTVAYIADYPTIRTFLWGLGFCCALYLLLQAGILSIQ